MKRILPREAIDPVRFITNHSTGRMGYALAEAAAVRGAEVILVSGPVLLTPPLGVETVPVVSAAEMAAAVKARVADQDIIICCAAVADMRPAEAAPEKLKKADMTGELRLEQTEDILAWAGTHRWDGQVLVGFSMETENLIPNSRDKLQKKNIDMIVANNVRVKGAGFGTETNVVTIITKEDTVELPLLGKDVVADRIFDAVRQYMEAVNLK